MVSAAAALSLDSRSASAEVADIEVSWQEQRRILEESYHATAAPEHVSLANPNNMLPMHAHDAPTELIAVLIKFKC